MLSEVIAEKVVNFGLVDWICKKYPNTCAYIRVRFARAWHVAEV
jgi:hypothetical protein